MIWKVIFCLFICLNSVPAATITFSGPTKTEDTYNGSYLNRNYGGLGYMVALDVATDWCLYIRFTGLTEDLLPGSTIQSAVCSVYLYTDYGAPVTLNAYYVFKPWVEGSGTGIEATDTMKDMSAQYWSATHNVLPKYAWTTMGGNSADDNGVDNTGNGIGADRTATPFATVVTAGVGWIYFNVPVQYIQDIVNGVRANRGIVLRPVGTPADSKYIRSSEGSPSSQHPKLVVDYTLTPPREKVLIPIR